MLAGAVMQLLFWLSLLLHQHTAGQQPRWDTSAGTAEPLLGGAESAVQSLSVKQARLQGRACGWLSRGLRRVARCR